MKQAAPVGGMANMITYDIPFKRIQFVTPTEVVREISKINEPSCSMRLTGEEASQFYNNIISLRSSSLKSKNDEKKTSDVKTLISNLELKVKPVKKIKIDYNSLFLYIQKGEIENVKNCIANGCCINYQDMYGWTPLMSATCAGHYSVVLFLMLSGANVYIKNKQGMTAMDIAQNQNFTSILKLLNEGPTSVNKNEAKKNKEKSSNSHKQRTCKICKSVYSVDTVEHERSIAHLLCLKRTELSTYYPIPESNKGFQIMVKKGWDKNKGLGLKAGGMKFPVKTVLKTDRSCIGRKKEVPRITHFGPNDVNAIKRNKVLKGRTIERERTLKKREREAKERKARRKEINFRREFFLD